MKQMQREDQVKLSQHDIESWKENTITKLFFSKLKEHSTRYKDKILSGTTINSQTETAKLIGSYYAMTDAIDLILVEMPSDK
jgi:hypothetical protein